MLKYDGYCISLFRWKLPSEPCSWRHNPLLGNGILDDQGILIYPDHELGGLLEPHVASRFTRLVIHLSDDFSKDFLVNLRNDPSEYIPREQKLKNQITYVAMQHVKILFKFPYIRKIVVDLGQQGQLLFYDELLELVERVLQRPIEVISPIILSTTIMEKECIWFHPLLALKNVEEIDFEFETDSTSLAPGEERFVLPQKYIDALGWIKSQVERDFTKP